jgi:hypothetical protein
VKLIYQVLNLKFYISVIFMINYSFSGGDVVIDSETLLVTDFVNLKIRLAQSFRVAHRNMMCVRVFIWMSAHTCMSICVYTVFLKKNYEGPYAANGRLLAHDEFQCPPCHIASA